jgi:hypothetical protein
MLLRHGPQQVGAVQLTTLIRLHVANPVLACGCETGVVPALLVFLAGERP